MNHSLPRSSIHGIFQARVLEWVDISFSRGSSWPRDQTQISRIIGRCFTIWATREVLLQKQHKFITEFVEGTSLMTQWLRIRLPREGTWVQSLAWEDSTCQRATRPVCVSQLRSPRLQLHPRSATRSYRSEKPAHRNWRVSPIRQRRPSTVKNIKSLQKMQMSKKEGHKNHLGLP